MNKLYYYLDYLQLHKEGRRDKVIERDRKMLDDEFAIDPKKGYKPTICKLLRDCIEHQFPKEQFLLDKPRNQEYTFVLKAKPGTDFDTSRRLIRAIDLNAIKGRFRGQTCVVDMNSFIANAAYIKPGSEAGMGTGTLAKITATDGAQAPKAYQAYKELKNFKRLTEVISRTWDERTAEFDFKRALEKMHAIRAITTTVVATPPKLVKADSVTKEDVEAKRLQMFPPGNTSGLSKAAQDIYILKLLNRKKKQEW